MSDLIHYEFPLNERIRLFIRLEQLFLQFDHFCRGKTVWDVRAAVALLIQLAELSNRSDLRSEAMQELDRQTSSLARMARMQSGVDQRMLSQAIERLEALNRNLFTEAGKPGTTLMEDDFFKGLMQRAALPGGATSFDLPGYHFWLEGQMASRSQQIESWIRPYLPVRSAIEVVLGYIRTSAVAVSEESVAGFYQKTLDHTLPYQLIRISLPATASYFAEISGGKHRFTVRFLSRDDQIRPSQVAENIPFRLTCCLF